MNETNEKQILENYKQKTYPKTKREQNIRHRLSIKGKKGLDYKRKFNPTVNQFVY
jgi:hypothetical protein